MQHRFVTGRLTQLGIGLEECLVTTCNTALSYTEFILAMPCTNALQDKTYCPSDNNEQLSPNYNHIHVIIPVIL